MISTILRGLAAAILVMAAACAKPPEEPPLPSLAELEARGSGIVVVKAVQYGGQIALDKALNVIVGQRGGDKTYNIGYHLHYMHSSFEGPRVIEMAAGSYFLAHVQESGLGTFRSTPADNYPDTNDAPEAFSLAPGEILNLGELRLTGRKVGPRRYVLRIDSVEKAEEARAALASRLPGAAERMVHRAFKFP